MSVALGEHKFALRKLEAEITGLVQEKDAKGKVGLQCLIRVKRSDTTWGRDPGAPI